MHDIISVFELIHAIFALFYSVCIVLWTGKVLIIYTTISAINDIKTLKSQVRLVKRNDIFFRKIKQTKHYSDCLKSPQMLGLFLF